MNKMKEGSEFKSFEIFETSRAKPGTSGQMFLRRYCLEKMNSLNSIASLFLWFFMRRLTKTNGMSG